MKTILCTFSFIIALWSFSFAFEIESRDGVPVINKYYLGSKPVWSDAEKQKIIELSPSSAPIKDSDFVPIAPTQSEQEILNDLMLDRKGGRDYFVVGLQERSKKDYILNKKLIPLQKEKESAVNLGNDTGIDTSECVTKIQADIDKYVIQYEAAAQ